MNDKTRKLEKYLDVILDRQNSPIPGKHLERVKQYKNYLQREIEAVKRKLTALKES